MQDIEYKKALMKGLGKNPEDYQKLESIAGKQEFIEFLKSAEGHPEFYQGNEDDFKNTRDCTFRANFHIHTVNSDGFMSIPEYLEMGRVYSDRFAKKHKGQKVFLAITDHDSVNGDIDALKIISEHPEKYKNLRIVLGVEMSSTFDSKYMAHPRDAHLLHYCVNPFDHPVTELNQERMDVMYHDFETALKNAEKKYKFINDRYGIKYSMDEAVHMRPQLKTFPHDARLTLKDYIEFKLLFAHLVEKNKDIAEILAREGIRVQDLDFTVPKFMIKIGKKEPYWMNYVDNLQIYLEKMLKEKNPQINLEEFRKKYGHINPEFIPIFKEVEREVLNPNSPIYVQFNIKPVNFEKVVRRFSKTDYTVSGIAHPAFTLRDEAGNPKKLALVNDFISRFKKNLNQKDFIIERYYPYERVLPQFIPLVYKVADRYHHLRSGSRDSHRNNFFSRAIYLEDKQLAELLAPKEVFRKKNHSISR